MTDKTRSYFLNEVGGLDSNNGMLMIGSTNHLGRLDPAILKRPSRFDRKYEFSLPGELEWEAYCRFWRGKLDGNNMVEFGEELCPVIAGMTEGFSFAYLKELFVSALLTITGGGTGGEDVGVVERDVKEKEDASVSTSSDDPVIVEKEDDTRAGAEGDDNSGSANAKPTEEASENKREVTEIEIPTHLRDNVLLKVIRSEIRTLLNEMDNTKDKGGKITGGGGLPGLDPLPQIKHRDRMMRSVVA